MFIDLEEILTHLYDEQIAAISGEDATMLVAAIDGAIAEAKGYLHKYDKEVIFATTGINRNALLVIFVKDIAVWHYINLANPGTDLKIRQDRYKAAIAWLRDVQAGNVVPDLSLPEIATADNQSISFSSNPKRGNYI